jgi:hypothetical protein
MPRAPRRRKSPKSPPPPAGTGRITAPAVTGGITASDVDRAADQLLRDGHRPTIERVRATIGRGSPNTINPLLDTWWQRLAGRLDAGPAALHRLPEPVLHAAEGLWMQTLDEARRRATAEQGSRRATQAKDRQDLEVRSHVLSIREKDIIDRLKQSESRVSRLEIEIESLVTMLRKEQASRAAAERRLAEVQVERQKARAPRGRRRSAVPTKRNAKSRKPAARRTSPRTGVARKRTVTTKRKPR